MEIVVRTPDFARVLRLIHTVADRKNTVPVLGSLLIRADTKGVSVTGTDMELGGISYCPAPSGQPVRLQSRHSVYSITFVCFRTVNWS